MIKLIVSNGGYVESNQYATILWHNNGIYAPNAKSALTSLSTSLLYEYVSEWLRYDCEPYEFEAWVYDLVKMNCDSGFRSFNHCFPWEPNLGFERARRIRKKDCLIIPENFEWFVVSLADPNDVAGAMEKDPGRYAREFNAEEYAEKLKDYRKNYSHSYIDFPIKDGYNFAVATYNSET